MFGIEKSGLEANSPHADRSILEAECNLRFAAGRRAGGQGHARKQIALLQDFARVQAKDLQGTIG